MIWFIVNSLLLLAGLVLMRASAYRLRNEVVAAMLERLLERLTEKRLVWAAEQQDMQDKCEAWERRAIALLKQHTELADMVLGMLQGGAERARRGQVH